MNESIKKFGTRLLSNTISVLIIQSLFLFFGWFGVTASTFIGYCIFGIFVFTVLDYLSEAIFHKKEN